MGDRLDEGGGSRVPSRPTVKKKDGLDDPALADAGPNLDSPDETVNLGPNHPEAVAQEGRPHGVDQSPNNGAGLVSGNPDDAASRLGLNSSDTGPEAVSIVFGGVASVDGNPGGVTAAEVVQSPSNVALEVIPYPNDVAEARVVEIPASDVSAGAVFNSDDLGPVALSNRDDVAPAVRNSGDVASGMAENLDDDALGVVQNLNNVALGADVLNPNDAAPDVAGNLDDLALGAVENPNDDASAAVPCPSDVAPGGVENSRNVVLGSILSSGGRGPVLAPNPDNVAHVAGILSDDTLGVDSESDDFASWLSEWGDFASWFGEPDDGAVQKLGLADESEIVEMEQNGAPQDEILWRRAVAEQDCNKLTELLAKDVTYFWKYEKKNKVGTALHAAATGRDLKLVRRILNLVSSAEEAGDLDMRFSDTRLDVDSYAEVETDAQGNTALVVAEQKNHAAIESKIRDYIANKNKRREYDEKRNRTSTVSSGNRAPAEVSKWNDAIKKKDCLALLQIFPDVSLEHASDVEKKLIGELVKVEVKNGKGGRQTGLQTAAMQGCFKLAELMLDRVYSHSDDIVEYILARDEVSGLTAFEMANDVIGNRSISELIKACYIWYGGNDKIKCRLHLNLENEDHMIGAIQSLRSVDAYPGTRWYGALEKGDTRQLKMLVQGNSRLVLETCHGLTVLHVAVLCNDLDLVKAVLELFCNEDTRGKPSIYWGKSYNPEELVLANMMWMYRKIDHGYVNEFWNMHNSQPLSKRMLKQLGRERNSVNSFAKIFKCREILDEMENACSTSTATTNVVYSTMPSWMRNFFKKNWRPTFDVEFEKDVDFNFEDPLRKDWLRVHYACKDPLKFKDFLQCVANYVMQPPYVAAMLLQTWDGKGRTPFHILMDHYNDEKDPGWPFDEIFNHECFKELIQVVENSRGKRIIDTILTRNYLQRNVILHPWAYFKVNFNYEKFERSEVTNFLYYQVAYLLKQKDMVQEIWLAFLDKKDLSNVLKRDQDAFNSMLFLAASTGNQTCLQSLLEINHDPMIIDSNGRSLLHHAADPTILLSQLLGHCSLTVEDVIDVKRKLTKSNTTYYPRPSSSTTYDGNLKGSKTMQEADSNSTKLYKTTNSNGTHASNSSTSNISTGERSNVGRKACILMLLQAGVDLGQTDKDNKVPTIGPTIDATYQSWWYDMVVKDSIDKKIAFGQAGNALSVVGTLVAATSYVGPLQPPLSFNDSGFLKTNEPLIKVFMVSNSVAFYLAMASVMFAVVSSLPMPQGVMSELNRAKHVTSLSLCLLQIAIGSIIISYATASIVAIQNENLFHPSDLLFSPSIIGWFFCLLGVGGFLIRLARLTFYKNRVVRNIYQFSFSKKFPWILAQCLWMMKVGLFGIVYYPLYTILVCLGFISSKIPLLKRRRIDFFFRRKRINLEYFFKRIVKC